MASTFIMGYSLYQILFYFLAYSVLGWVMETIFVSCQEKQLVKRGFLTGCYCPIYGFGMCGILLLLRSYTVNPLVTFLGGIVLATVLEYFTGWLLETLFHARWWDYTSYKYNFRGRISLWISVSWGVLSVLCIYVIHPIIADLTRLIPQKMGETALYMIYTLGALDLAYSFYGAAKLSNKLQSLVALHEELQSLILQSELYETAEEAKNRIMNAKFSVIVANTSEAIKENLTNTGTNGWHKLQQAMEEVAGKYNRQVLNMRMNEARFIKAYPNFLVLKAASVADDIRDLIKKSGRNKQENINAKF